MYEYTQLGFALNGDVATLTLNSPPVNELTLVLNDELTLALNRIGEQDEIAPRC